jgi:hypothetical protein
VLLGRILVTGALTGQALEGMGVARSRLDRARDIARSTGSRYLAALADVQESALLLTLGDYGAVLHVLSGVSLDDLETPWERYTVHLNRGVAHVNRAELVSARGEIESALELAEDMADPVLEFKARHDMGFVAHLAGDVPRAIRLMREADEQPVDVERVSSKQDLAMALLDAGLVDPALVQLDDGIREARRIRHRLAEGELLLTRARAHLLVDDRPSARRDALAAGRAFAARDDRVRAVHAGLVADAAGGPGDRARRQSALDARLVDEVVDIDPDIARFALRARARALVHEGRPEAARVMLARVPRRRAEGIADSLLDALVRTEILLAEGRRDSGHRQLRVAAARLAAHQGRSQSVEVRASVAVHGRALAAIDIGEALATGRPHLVFDAVERWRAASSRGAIATPEEPRTRALLDRLRVARHAAADPEASREVAREARLRAAALSAQVSAQLWTAADEAGRTHGAAGRYGEVRQQVVDRGEQLLLFFEHGGQCHRLAIGAGRPTLTRLGRTEDVAGAARRLVDDLAGLAHVAHVPALRATLQRAVDSSALALDRLLLHGIEPGPGGVVIAPNAPLSRTPWGMLPGLHGVPVGVCVSVTRWARTESVNRASDIAALAGPDVERGAEEAASVVERWTQRGGSSTMRARSTAGDLRDAIGHADLVHVAAHGTHEDQNPLFSAVHLYDGPVVVHELPQPPRAKHVVLSACDLGRSRVRAGDEPLGLTAGLLTIGVETVVASVVPVRDSVAADAMVGYHEFLASGSPATKALASAIREVPEAAGFCVFGSDWQVV